ncbi:MAG: hypothetical protein HYU97_07605 [Deltaproteobacteria bacterium]|nr:hypothetical protein [Deltaproteobacteria bacterium]
MITFSLSIMMAIQGGPLRESTLFSCHSLNFQSHTYFLPTELCNRDAKSPLIYNLLKFFHLFFRMGFVTLKNVPGLLAVHKI